MKMLKPSDLLHELEQGERINKDIKELFRQKGFSFTTQYFSTIPSTSIFTGSTSNITTSSIPSDFTDSYAYLKGVSP